MLTLSGYWYIAAAARELRGRQIRRDVEGQTLVLFRDSAGQPHALTDRCAHRGMALSRGTVAGDCIQCPYHGWKYDGLANVVDVPALCSDEPLPAPKTVRSHPIAEQDEQLWVWIGEQAPRDPPPRFPHCGEAGWRTFFMQTRFEAPVDACLENFLDVPHTLMVHPGLFRGEKQQQTKTIVRSRPDGVEAEFINEQPLDGIGPRLFFPRGTKMTHTDRFILPSMTRVDYLVGEGEEVAHGFVMTSQCTQRGQFVVDVTTAITWRLPAPAWLVGPFARWYCRRVIQQDVDILKIQGEQLRRFRPVFHSTAADLLGVQIRSLRRRAAAGDDISQDEPAMHRENVLNL